MVADLKKAFKAMVVDVSWMDAATKSIAQAKVDAMVELIGYPSWILNSTALTDYYAEVSNCPESPEMYGPFFFQ